MPGQHRHNKPIIHILHIDIAVSLDRVDQQVTVPDVNEISDDELGPFPDLVRPGFHDLAEIIVFDVLPDGLQVCIDLFLVG